MKFLKIITLIIISIPSLVFATNDIQEVPVLQTQEPSVLQIGTITRPPFTMLDQAKNLTGFSVELWEEISKRKNIKYKWIEFDVFQDMIDSTTSNTTDASIANITITAEREKTLDFSQPIYNSGFQILTKKTNIFINIFNNLLSSGVLWFVLIALLLVVWITYILWFKISKKISLFWVLFCILFFTILFYNSNHLININREIDSVSMLGGKKVGSINTQTFKNYLVPFGVTPIFFRTYDDLYSALMTGKIDAVIGDAPILQYYKNHSSNTKLKLQWPVFKPENYAIIFPEGSELKELVDQAIIETQEDGSYAEIYNKYFSN